MHDPVEEDIPVIQREMREYGCWDCEDVKWFSDGVENTDCFVCGKPGAMSWKISETRVYKKYQDMAR